MLHWWTKTLLHTTFATLSYGYIRGSYVHYNTVYTSVSIMLQLLKTLGLQLLTLPLESSSGSTQSMSVYIIDDPEPETSKEFTAGAYLAMNTHTHTHTHTHTQSKFVYGGTPSNHYHFKLCTLLLSCSVWFLNKIQTQFIVMNIVKNPQLFCTEERYKRQE